MTIIVMNTIRAAVTIWTFYLTGFLSLSAAFLMPKIYALVFFVAMICVFWSVSIVGLVYTMKCLPYSFIIEAILGLILFNTQVYVWTVG